MTIKSVDQPRKILRRAYLPISSDAWDRLMEYMRQAERHLKDPTSPEPDIRLLADADHGPFNSIVPGHDCDGRPCIYFQARLGATKPRNAPPLVVLMARLHLAFGGGMHFNDNGTGWSGVRLGSRNCKPMLLRLVAGAGIGEVMRQRRGSNYRSQDPDNFVKVPVETLWEEGKPIRIPKAGRTEMIAYSLDKFRKHQRRSGIVITEADYRDALRRVYAIIDATFNAEDLGEI